MKNIHPSITKERLHNAVEEQMFGTENPGFCISCGDYHDGCEPDAENYPCYGCGKKKVFAAEALLMRVGGLFKRRVA